MFSHTNTITLFSSPLSPANAQQPSSSGGEMVAQWQQSRGEMSLVSNEGSSCDATTQTGKSPGGAFLFGFLGMNPMGCMTRGVVPLFPPKIPLVLMSSKKKSGRVVGPSLISMPNNKPHHFFFPSHSLN